MTLPTTVAAMERGLRALLLSDRVTVRLREMAKKDGFYVTDPSTRRSSIALDPDGDRIGALLHELVHIAYRSHWDKWGDLEEPQVKALEDVLHRYVNRSARRLQWWRETLRAKVAVWDD